MSKSIYAALLTAVAFFGSTGAVGDPIQFEDESSAAGFGGASESWGIAWGDMNSDNWPDLFHQAHRFDFPRLYRNTGTGIFEDVAYEHDPGNIWMNEILSQDRHGPTWIDFDNDGDDDLLISVSASGTGRAQLLVNEISSGGTFVERAQEADLANDSSARMSTWFDYDNDGYLDVVQQAQSQEYLRRRDITGAGIDFDDVTTGFCPGLGTYGQLADLNNDGTLDFICGVEGTQPAAILDYSSGSFANISSVLPTIGSVNDTIVGDFNNDLLTDMILIRGAGHTSGATQTGPNNIAAWIRKGSGSSNKGFTFAATGQVTFTIDHRGMGNFEASKVQVLNTSGPTSATVGPLQISYSSGSGLWDVKFTTTSTSQAYVKVAAVNTISNLNMHDLDGPEGPLQPYHAVNNGSTLNFVFTTGLSIPAYCNGGATADFDNDGDLDLYFTCGRGAENLPNRYFDNQGDGTFVEVLGHGGEGPLGADPTIGVADNVALADYDVDGFVDAAVANGLLYFPIGIGGSDTLLRNQGNGNHWIEIDLVGVTSNRDGIGAKVFATAGGATQLREQGGGFHRFTQNHQRIHFGLGLSTTVDITVEWPSGTVDNFNNVDADQLYELVEGGSITPAVLGPPVFTDPQPGDECGEPNYNKFYGPATVIWRDCGSDDWHVRMRGGRSSQLLNTTGDLVGDAAFDAFSGVSLNGDDSVENSPSHRIDFSTNVWFVDDVGFDFNTGIQNESCFSLSNQEIDPIVLGSSRKLITAPLDLVGLDDCEPPPPQELECGEPTYDRGSELGLFLWRDCGFPGPNTFWTLRITGGGAVYETYAGEITASTEITATGYSLEGNDVVDSAAGDMLVDWVLRAGGSGEDGFSTEIPAGADTCFDPYTLPGGAQVELGMNRQIMNGAFSLETLEPCTTPEPAPECGVPNYNQASEPGVFLWKDCNHPGPGALWTVRVVAGGLAWQETAGALSADMNLSASTFSLEGADIVDSNPGDGEIDFSLFVGGSGQDGFTTEVPDGAQSCFDVTILPAGASVYIGENKLELGTPFNLEDLGPCN